MIEREIKALWYLSLSDSLKKMRERFGFRNLTTAYDEAAQLIALIRNCLVHNQGKVDSKLAGFSPDHETGTGLAPTMADVHAAIETLRKLAYEIDKTFERIGGKSG